jgi:hypothetical protein
MSQILLSFLTVILILCTLATTIRLSLPMRFRPPSSDGKFFKMIIIITHPGWCFALLLFMPWFLGEFARGETSPLPWVAFMDESYRHGFFSGLFTFLVVVLVDLWLFWTTANVWIYTRDNIDKEKARMARIINISVGLVFVTIGNPIYQLMARF